MHSNVQTLCKSQYEQLDPEDEFIGLLVYAAPNPQELHDVFPWHFSNTISRCPELVSCSSSIAIAFCNWLLQLDGSTDYLKSVAVFEFYILVFILMLVWNFL